MTVTVQKQESPGWNKCDGMAIVTPVTRGVAVGVGVSVGVWVGVVLGVGVGKAADGRRSRFNCARGGRGAVKVQLRPGRPMPPFKVQLRPGPGAFKVQGWVGHRFGPFFSD